VKADEAVCEAEEVEAGVADAGAVGDVLADGVAVGEGAEPELRTEGPVAESVVLAVTRDRGGADSPDSISTPPSAAAPAPAPSKASISILRRPRELCCGVSCLGIDNLFPVEVYYIRIMRPPRRGGRKCVPPPATRRRNASFVSELCQCP
jgi:hypothetical protein